MEDKVFRDFGKFIFSNCLISLLLPLVITLLIHLPAIVNTVPAILNNDFNWSSFWKDYVLSSLLEFSITFLLITLPLYFIHLQTKNDEQLLSQIKENNEKMTSQLGKIDRCPRMVAFHTDGSVLKNKLDKMDEIKESNIRWIMSKFISKVLTDSFTSFSVQIPTNKYSEFSSEIFKECKKSIFLTGSMRPSTWLNSLWDEKKTEKRADFFNNLKIEDDNDTIIKEYGFPINPKNHSLTITRLEQSIERKRIVCLSKYDMDHLFISEQSIRTYFKINEGINTTFLEWQGSPKNDMNPFKFEYALYDNALLFKYDKNNMKLTVLTPDDNEFSKVSNFFIDNESKAFSQGEILSKIQSQKNILLNNIICSNTLPHKYSYLYSGGERWVDFVTKNTTTFTENAITAISLAINYARKKELLNEKTYDIVEIGAGEGRHISSICEAFGITKIDNYTILDISEHLLNLAKEKIKDVIPAPRKHSTVLLDCCDKDNRIEFVRTITNKIVIIPSNSTLFQEKEFMCDELKKAKMVIITLDKYLKETSFEDQLAAQELFLMPLKIIGVPIIKEIIKNNVKRLFSSQYRSPDFSILFNLKLYSELLDEDKKYKGRYTFDDRLKNITTLKVLSSLKFEKRQNIMQYFGQKGFEVESEELADTGFFGIILTPKNATTN